MSSPSPSVSVVDDDDEVRAALTRLVASAGYRTRAYGNAHDFLHDAASHRPDCVVLDLHMPGTGGFDVLRVLAQMNVDVPVVAITGFDSALSRTTALALGARSYLCKPVDGDSLLAAIAGTMA